MPAPTSVKEKFLAAAKVCFRGIGAATASVLTLVFAENTFLRPLGKSSALRGIVIGLLTGALGGLLNARDVLNVKLHNRNAQAKLTELERLERALTTDTTELKSQTYLLEHANQLSKQMLQESTFAEEKSKPSLAGVVYDNRAELQQAIRQLYENFRVFKAQSKNLELDVTLQQKAQSYTWFHYLFNGFTSFMSGAGMLLFPAMAYKIFEMPTVDLPVGAIASILSVSAALGVYNMIMECISLRDENVALLQINERMAEVHDQCQPKLTELAQVQTMHLAQLTSLLLNLKASGERDLAEPERLDDLVTELTQSTSRTFQALHVSPAPRPAPAAVDQRPVPVREVVINMDTPPSSPDSPVSPYNEATYLLVNSPSQSLGRR